MSDVETEEGEILIFNTPAEFAAFRAGFDWGDRYGTEKDWGDGYREGDLVDVEFYEENLTAIQRIATGDPACQRCGALLVDGRCEDATCPFSDHDQDCRAGWANHPHWSFEDTACTCKGREDKADDPAPPA